MNQFDNYQQVRADKNPWNTGTIQYLSLISELLQVENMCNFGSTKTSSLV